MSTILFRIACLTLLLAVTDCQARPELSTTLKGHTGWIGAVAFSPDSKQIATGSADRTVRIWGVADGKSVYVLKGHTNYVSAVAFGPESFVVRGTFDGTVRRWTPTLGTGTLAKRRGAVLSVAFSRDGNTIAAGGIDGVITLMDSGGKPLGKLTGHKTWVNSLAFNRDGTRLVSGSSDGTARLWDVKTKKQIKAFTLSDPSEIRSVALSPDGKTIAAGVRYGIVKAWDVDSGKESASLTAHDGDAWSVSFAPDGKTLVSGGGDWGKPGTVKLWNTKTWKERLTLDHPGEVLCVAVSPDGKWLAVGGMDRTVRLWDLGKTKK